ncbi:MAG: hypothetical protein ACE5QV_08350, partial [Fidelibacterota bacterium]
IEKYSHVENKKNPPSYLYWKRDLISQRSLGILTGFLHGFFNRCLFISLLTIVAVSRIFLYTALSNQIFNITGLSLNEYIFLTIAIFFSSLFHELGHSSACRHFRVQHGPIGIGLYLYFPVFFADVTDAWRLPRMNRAIIDFGGIYFQLLYATLFLGIAPLLPENYAFHLVFLIDLLILTSLNPVFRWDGYWIFSDLAGIPNLRKRALEAGSYILRRIFLIESKTRPEFFNFPVRIRYLIYSYSIISNLFFLFIWVNIVRFFPDLIKSYQQFLISLLETTVSGGISANELFGRFFNNLRRFLFHTFILLMIGFSLLRMLRLLRAKFLRLLGPQIKKN